MGRYDEPRRLLAHVLGEPAEEFAEARERAVCSGAGGLLPRTMPEVSARIGAARAAAAGDRPIVTACASSLRRFRRDEKNAFDLFELLARALTRRDSEAT
ncbi:MAG: heterodisulfide reductase-related iron-sulfur binding cluster [Polyangiaceae bacterium]